MEIRKGDRFYCHKDVVMNDSGKTAYTKGKIYKSDEDWNLPDDECMYHTWHNQFDDEHEVFKDHFAKIGQYKGDLEGFPELIVDWMLTEQELQGNKRDVGVFEGRRSCAANFKGFTWDFSKYFDEDTCLGIIEYRNFQLFFDKYPQGIPKETKYIEVESREDMPSEKLKKHFEEMNQKYGGDIVESATEKVLDTSKIYNELQKIFNESEIHSQILTQKQKIKKAKAKIKKLKKKLK